MITKLKTIQKNLFAANRAIFQNSPSKGPSLSEQAWEDFSATAEFSAEDFEATLNQLAVSSGKKISPEAIKNSIAHDLDQSKSVENLVKFLADNNCKKVSYVRGALKAYAENGNEIDIAGGDFTRPIQIEVGADDTTLAYETAQENLFADDTKAREDLLAEILLEQQKRLG